jgi:hypothetical protein
LCSGYRPAAPKSDTVSYNNWVCFWHERRRKRYRNTNRKEIAMSVIAMCLFSILQYRQRYIPLVSRCCQRGGEVRLSRRAHNPQSGFHFCKIAGGRKFKSTPRYFFFSNKKFVFSMPYLCNGFVRCLCALGVGIYNPVKILRSCGTRIFFVLRSLCLHLSH